MALWKKNNVEVDITKYRHYIRAVPKFGKTTLFYEVIKELYNGDTERGLLISCGNEVGYKALEDLVVADCPTYDDVADVVDELCENKEDNNFEVIAFDTVDTLIDITKRKVIQIDYKKTGTKHEFNGCLGGYGAPRAKVTELITDMMGKLERAGYGIWFIGHTKIKDVKEKGGVEYQMLTSNLNADYDAIFSGMADVMMMGVMEKSVDEDKHIDEIKRYMYFRGDNFIDAGGRFSTMPNRVELSAKNYIKAVKEGIAASMKRDNTDAEQPAKKTSKISKVKSEPVEDSNDVNDVDASEEDAIVTVESLIAQISTIIGGMDASTKKAKQAEIKAEGLIANFKKITDVDMLQKYIEVLSR
ncbi:MAG: ATP-binding protein [Bacteroidaceae bacterium]|nr:ATP-binding protein [Bacteroidaceae bacterium]